MSENIIGYTFQTKEGPIQVKSKVGTDFRITDPTVTHPQDSRSGMWNVDAETFKEDLQEGNIERASLKVEVDA